MKRKSISVSEETHTQFFKLRKKFRDMIRLKVNSDYVLLELIKAFNNNRMLLNTAMSDMYQLEEKQ